MWIRDLPLKDIFSRLFANLILKDATSGEVEFWNEDQWIYGIWCGEENCLNERNY